MRKPALRSVATLVLLILSTWSGISLAGGFQISELTPRGQGNRNAGAAAAAESASTIYFNPAGLTHIDQPQIEAGLHVILPRFEFSDKGSTNTLGGPIIGDTSSDGATTAVVPNAFIAYPIDERMTLGLGITVPYGLVTEYDSDWIGRYNAIKSDVLTININPALGYKVSDEFSIGIGLIAEYVDVELTSAIDFGTLGFLGGAPGFTPSNPRFDARNKMTGDDWGFGFNLGIHWEPTPSTAIGLGYRSGVKHDVEGKNSVDIPTAVTAVLPLASFTRDAEAELTLPATLYLGFKQKLNNKVTLLAGASWTEWSEFKELRISFPGSSDPDSVQPENWKNVWRYSLGLNYEYNQDLTLRTGIQYDESPIPKAFRTPRIPGTDRTWLALGFTYRLSPQFVVDFAYSHVFLDDFTIDDKEVTTGGRIGDPTIGNTLVGDYKADADMLSAQIQWNF